MARLATRKAAQYGKPQPLLVALAFVLGGVLFSMLPRLLGAPACLGSSDGARLNSKQRIPKILHKVYLEGRPKLGKLRGRHGSAIKPEWDDWCRLVHTQAEWSYVFWDNVTATQLLLDHYAWFLPTWSQLETVEAREDAIRPFLLHKYGGVYIDMDVECYRDGYDMLEGSDLVLQGSTSQERVTNAAMASVAGHPFWELVLAQLQGGGANSSTVPAGSALLALALDQTGVIEGPARESSQEGPWQGSGSYQWKQSTLTVHPLGQWYSPCAFSDTTCQKLELQRRAEGIVRLDLVGHHHHYRPAIPKILHRVFLSGRSKLNALYGHPNTSIKPEWDDWCRLVHTQAGWQYMFWDNASVTQLLEEHYPWFLPTWAKYEKIVSKGDAIRPFLLHKYGGVYIDMDVECYRDGYNMLEGADIVLQGTIGGENVTNAAIASVAGHPFWKLVFQKLEEHVHEADNPAFATGPGPIAMALSDTGAVIAPPQPTEKEDPDTFWRWRANGTWHWGQSRIRIYPLGSWYCPCWFSHADCQRRELENKANGVMRDDLVGNHHYTSTWWEPHLRIGHENDPAQLTS